MSPSSPEKSPSKPRGRPFKSGTKGKEKVKSPRDTRLPHYKIKQMMKTTPNVAQVANDASYTMTLATELFVEFLAEKALRTCSTNVLEYKNIADVVHNEDKFRFLREVIPQKITVRRYKELMERNENQIPPEDLPFYLG